MNRRHSDLNRRINRFVSQGPVVESERFAQLSPPMCNFAAQRPGRSEVLAPGNGGLGLVKRPCLVAQRKVHLTQSHQQEGIIACQAHGLAHVGDRLASQALPPENFGVMAPAAFIVGAGFHSLGKKPRSLFVAPFLLRFDAATDQLPGCDHFVGVLAPSERAASGQHENAD
jgi:hypothetical protein